MQETTTLIETSEETSHSVNVLDDSTASTDDNPDNRHSFGETIIFDNIFNDNFTSFNEWNTDNLSIFGTSDTGDTIGWNIFEDSIIDTTERIKNTIIKQNLVTTTIKASDESDVVEDIEISNTDTTELLSKLIDSSSTTEFSDYFRFDEFQESTTNVANSEDTVKDVDNGPNTRELILKIMEELKKPYLEGIPGVDIPDPDPIPDMSQSITIFDKLYFTNSAVRGMSKLRILYVNIDIEALEVRTYL